MEGLAFAGVPVAFNFTNEGREDVQITDVKVNQERSLTSVLRFGSPNSTFEATTLSQGESISLNCPVQGPVNEVTVYTNHGSKTFNLRNSNYE